MTPAKIYFLFDFRFTDWMQNKVELDSNGVPSTLVIGAFVGEGPEEFIDRYKGVEEYLEKKMGMDVEILFVSDYTAVIESLRSKKIHVAYMAPFSYVLSYNSGNFRPILTVGKDGKPYTYRSVIITSKNSGLKSMDDVRARAKELSMCFTDPASASGHLVPRGYLTTIGLDPTNSFKETLFASSHAASVMSVISGKVDFGCTYESALQKLIDNGSIKGGDIITLWTSDPMMNSPVVVRNDINEEFVKRLQDAYLSFPKGNSKAWESYLSNLYPNPTGLDYIIACDSMYNGIRKIAAGIKDLNVNL